MGIEGNAADTQTEE